jgi:hypothetical protein
MHLGRNAKPVANLDRAASGALCVLNPTTLEDHGQRRQPVSRLSRWTINSAGDTYWLAVVPVLRAGLLHRLSHCVICMFSAPADAELGHLCAPPRRRHLMIERGPCTGKRDDLSQSSWKRLRATTQGFQFIRPNLVVHTDCRRAKQIDGLRLRSSLSDADRLPAGSANIERQRRCGEGTDPELLRSPVAEKVVDTTRAPSRRVRQMPMYGRGGQGVIGADVMSTQTAG